MPDRFGDPRDADPRSVREACMDDIRATIAACTKRSVLEALEHAAAPRTPENSLSCHQGSHRASGAHPRTDATPHPEDA